MERRSRECGIRMFGVKENKVEYNRKILAKDVLLRHILGGIVTLEQDRSYREQWFDHQTNA